MGRSVVGEQDAAHARHFNPSRSSLFSFGDLLLFPPEPRDNHHHHHHLQPLYRPHTPATRLASHHIVTRSDEHAHQRAGNRTTTYQQLNLLSRTPFVGSGSCAEGLRLALPAGVHRRANSVDTERDDRSSVQCRQRYYDNRPVKGWIRPDTSRPSWLARDRDHGTGLSMRLCGRTRNPRPTLHNSLNYSLAPRTERLVASARQPWSSLW